MAERCDKDGSLGDIGIYLLKLGKYATAGVREYWLIDPDRERVCVYWTPEEDIAAVYGPQDDVPVGIFGGEFCVPMSRIFEQIRSMGV